jgi:hypothetical protein
MSALDGGEWSASRLCHFATGKQLTVPVGYVGSLVGPGASLDFMEKRKIAFHAGSEIPIP